MSASLQYVVYSALLIWLMLYVAAIIRTRAWTPQGLKIAFGNRQDTFPLSSLAFRVDQTAQNTLEGFVLFAALVSTAHLAGANNAQTEFGARLFFWARVAYIPVYLIGIAYSAAAWFMRRRIYRGILPARHDYRNI